MAKITVFESLVGTEGKILDASWLDLFDFITRDIEQPMPVNETAAPGWSPTIFKENRRAKKNVIQTSAMVLDFDGDASIVDVKRELAHFVFFLHTTRKNMVEDKQRFRVILPLTRPVAQDEFDRIWQGLFAYFPTADAATRDASRFWFQARSARPFHAFKEYNSTGQLIDPDKHFLFPSLEIAKAEISLAKPGERNSTLNAQAFAVASAGVPRSIAEEGIRIAAYSAGLDEREVSKTIGSAFNGATLCVAKKPAKQSEVATNCVASDDVIFSRGDHVELAQHLVKMFPNVAHDGFDFFEYTHGTWATTSQVGLCNAVIALAGATIVGASGKPSTLKVNDSTIHGVISALKPMVFRDFSVKEPGVSFKNERVFVDSGCVAMRPASKDDNEKHGLPYNFEPLARALRFERMLCDMFDSLTDARALVLQEFVGACMFGVGSTYQKCLLLFGTGGNGKSALLRAIEACFHRDACTALSATDFKESHMLSMLKDKKINIVNEMPNREILASEVFKLVVTGEKVQVNRKYKDAIDITMRAGHIFAANSMPVTLDTASGFFRRFIVIDMPKRFDTSDDRVLDLGAQLAATEAQGIAAWAVRGLERLLKQGAYTDVPQSSEIIKDWANDSDNVRLWVKDEVRDDERARIAPRALYKLYCDWASGGGYAKVNERNFFKRLEAVGHFKHKLDGFRHYRVRVVPTD